MRVTSRVRAYTATTLGDNLMTAPIGLSVKRRENRRFLLGRGRYVDDLRLADLLHAAIVRSPHAHARVLGVDARRALALPGVVAVLTIAELPECPRSCHRPGSGRTPSRRSRARRLATPARAWRWRSPTTSTAPPTPPRPSRSATARYPRWPPSRRRSRRALRGSSTSGPTTPPGRPTAPSVTSPAASPKRT